MADWLRGVPGFRAGVRWKQGAAFIGYLAILYLAGTGEMAGLVVALLALLAIVVGADPGSARPRQPGIKSGNTVARGTSSVVPVGAA